MSRFSLSWVLIAVAALGIGCGRTNDGVLGGETNWLSACDDDAACGEYGSCMCGLCSEGCDQDNDCPDGLVCKQTQSQLVLNACGAEAERGICAPECEQNVDCGTAQACIENACTPTTDDSMSGGGATPDAYIVAAIEPDADCNVSPDSEQLVPSGQLDISTGFNSDSDACSEAYRPTFKLASYRNELIQISGAEIRLTDINRATILFDRTDPVIPNPFEVISNQTLLPSDDSEVTLGAVALELIPRLYAAELDNFAANQEQIIAEIKLHARDASNRALNVPSFLYVIDICDGCLTLCGGDLPSETTDEEIYGANVCMDNASADGRVCVDWACPPSR